MLDRPTAFATFHHHHARGSSRTALAALPATLQFPNAAAIFLCDDDAALTATATTFEPVLNVPALGSFILIMTVFLLLRLRVNAISDAAETRMAALETLRQVKSDELSSGTGYKASEDRNNNSEDGVSSVSPEKVKQAVEAYRTALTREEGLRNLIPGIRLRAPNNPQRSEGDRQAVRQFLDDEDLKNLLLEVEENSTDDDLEEGPSTIALTTLLAVVFGSQVILFLFLSMDDTTANQVLTELSASTSDSIGGSVAEVTGNVAEAIGDMVSSE